ncbi:MAG: Clp1/GlmU family protein [Candidatus Poribacteria bacterium]|nr:Clp1/GlmU family protein [Candidatus Poribacteria bacterium]MDE0505752.1 Clp1/GlmU family protein [Candidatus Poribacteria bacterium]
MKGDYQGNHDWERIARRIIHPQAIVLVIGSVDTGKSTFCRFLVEQGLARGLTVGLVDADLGQSQIGPPATIGLKVLSQNPDWNEIEADDLYFVGWISPEGHSLRCVTGVRLMVDTAVRAGVDFVVVDTSGYVKGRGAVTLKQHKIEIIQPRHLVCIQRSGELDEIVAGFDDIHPVKVHRLAPHRASTSKTSDFRRKYRESRVNRYFSETVEACLPFERFRGQRTPYFVGRSANARELEILSDLAETRVLYAEWGHRTLALVTQEVLPDCVQSQLKHRLSLSNLVARPQRYFERRFVGLIDARGKTVSVAIIKAVDFEANCLTLLCKPDTAENTKIVQFGRYKDEQVG